MKLSAKTSHHAVRPILESEIQRASRIVVDAFFHDPFWEFVFPDPKERRSRGPGLAASLVRCAHLFGKAWVTDGLEGIALRRLPGQFEMPPWQLIRSGMALQPFAMGFGPFKRLLTLLGEMEKRHAEVTLPPHWHAWILAVQPEHQGKGYGGALMRHTFRETQGAGLYLETLTEKSAVIHENHGYRTLTDRALPGTGIRIWTMWRDPEDVKSEGNI